MTIQEISMKLTITILVFAMAFPIRAETAADILAKLEENQLPRTAIFTSKLTVSNSFGVTASEFKAWSRKGGDTLIEIISGPDKGQKILRQKSNIYLFYPEAEEVIWLKGSALKDSMMGSDFSYEDLTDDKTLIDRFSATIEGSETIDGSLCNRLLLIAKSKTETYAKEELWVDANLYVTRKAILYSASGKPLRELRSTDVRAVQGKNIAFTSVMKDLLKKGSSTEMTIMKAEINVPIAEKYFNRDELSW